MNSRIRVKIYIFHVGYLLNTNTDACAPHKPSQVCENLCNHCLDNSKQCFVHGQS